MIDSLPGVTVDSHLFKHSFNEMRSGWLHSLIFLHIDQSEPEGLFFLTRCLDRRYWVYGNQWEIKLSVGDVIYENGDRPITYIISLDISDKSESDLVEQCESLIENMSYHFHHDAFMSGFNMNRDKYKECRLQYTTKSWERDKRIRELGI